MIKPPYDQKLIDETALDLQRFEKTCRKEYPKHDLIELYDSSLDYGINLDFAEWELELRKYV